MTPKQLKQIRTRLSLTQKELAKQLGYSVASVSAWEQGLRPILPRAESAINGLMWDRVDDYIKAVGKHRNNFGNAGPFG